MSRAHQLFGTVAQFYEQGGKWGQGPHYTRAADSYCISEVVIQFTNAASDPLLDAEASHLWREKMGCDYVAYNDVQGRTKEQVIDVCNWLSEGV